MAERKSTFKDDLKSERAVNEFLQKYLYSYLVDDGIINSFNSNTVIASKSAINCSLLNAIIIFLLKFH